MAVTDLTPTFSPDVTGQDVSGSGGLTNDWLNYLYRFFGPNAAQAAGVSAGGYPTSAISALNAAAAAARAGNPQAGPPNIQVPQNAVPPAPQPPQGPLAANGPAGFGDPYGVWGGSGGQPGPNAPPFPVLTPAPAAGQPVPTGAAANAPQFAPASNAPPAAAARPNPAAAGGQAVQGVSATPRNPFTLISAPNADPLRRGGAPMMSALDLSGMFGRGQGPGPTGGPAATPQGAARGGGTRPGPFPYGQSTTPGGPFMPFDITGYPVAGVNAPVPGALSRQQLAANPPQPPVKPSDITRRQRNYYYTGEA